MPEIATALSGAVSLYNIYLTPVDVGETLHYKVPASSCRDDCSWTLSGENLRDASYWVEISAKNLITTGMKQNCSSFEIGMCMTRNNIKKR